MNKPNALLKVVSILHIVFSSIAIVLVLILSTFAGSLVSMLYDAAGVSGGVGAGFLTGGTLFVAAIAGSLLNLVAGILGLKCRVTGCRVLGIILLVCTVIETVLGISAFDGAATVIVMVLLRLIMPILYVWGAFKQPRA